MNENRGLWRGKQKYDGKPHKKGEWIEGYFTRLDDNCAAIIPHIYGYGEVEVDEDTLGESAGLSDKNEKLIFEGDIVKYINSIGIIRFGQYHSPFSPPSECHLGFYVDWEGRDSKNLRKDLVYWVGFKPVIIIGNIHDSPELLRATGEDIGNAANETILSAT